MRSPHMIKINHTRDLETVGSCLKGWDLTGREGWLRKPITLAMWNCSVSKSSARK